MNISMAKKNVVARAGLGVGSLAIAAAIGAGGYALGSQSSWVANSAYQNGYNQASYNFCNLKFSTGADAGKPYTDDIREYDHVPANVLVADAVCTDGQVKAWNSAQESAGSPERACKLDLDIAYIVGALDAAECVVTDSLN
ncbi:hypothetical protein SAMN06295879_0239 [Agreia bicolorata]|uniref:Uncharacterized protein n=1 Tax=Agreia bicolorata TaxID=110935 RepID=A0A1T4WTS3_9MICO|nr:hypothetical protein [Agreia bicolorata]SKA80762.1 hypothetical protein SAMN06295879_0239 [Agreia bicolorata]